MTPLDRETKPRAGERRGAEDAPPSRSRGRSLNEAAHKVEHWPGRRRRTPAPAPPAFGADDDHDVVAHAGRLALALGALGVVYGDIGTSPLYTEQVVFSGHAVARSTVAGVYGVASLIVWSLMIVVTIKYAGIIMRAHNRGDGGIMALTALVQRRRLVHGAILMTVGIFGAALFFGDGMITPAISVLSAVEGLKVVSPGLDQLVVPISLGILAGLFLIQRRGTAAVGWLFGPVLLAWFACIGALGAGEVLRHPSVLQGLSPVWGIRFLLDHGGGAFLVLGGVVLAVTGAEALYADRGHFGAWPIRFTWISLVLPALVLNYLGQAALILSDPRAIGNPFLFLVPSGWRLPMVFLATAATIIASQATITGSFSVARQAVQLGLLPRLRIRHTSELEGQIYVGAVNWVLAIGVGVLVLAFQSSSRLANVYGVAVTATFILNSALFLAIARAQWRWAKWRVAALGALFLSVETVFFAANVIKVTHGAWLPLAVGLLISAFMVTWRRGQVIVTRNRQAQEGSLELFLARLAQARPPISRSPGTGIFLSPSQEMTPLALRAQVEHNQVLQEKIVLVTLEPVSVPRVGAEDRFAVQALGQGRMKVLHVTIHVGYRDGSDVPAQLALARKRGLLERNLDLEGASYFLSRISIVPGAEATMRRWRKRLFITMARNCASPIEHFALPPERTVEMGSQVTL